MRYKCVIAYDGTNFHGFQTQLNKRTVQEEFEKALMTITKVKTNIFACSRTDSHVHATYQVIHFDTELDINPWNMKKAINSYLPNDIYVRDVEKVVNLFHSQHNVVEKEYHYLMLAGKDLKATQTAIARTVTQLKKLGITGSDIGEFVSGAEALTGTRVNMKIETNGEFRNIDLTLA